VWEIIRKIDVQLHGGDTIEVFLLKLFRLNLVPRDGAGQGGRSELDGRGSPLLPYRTATLQSGANSGDETRHPFYTVFGATR
jgi:hypothetical protein